jgi:O-antigen ligase
MSLPISPTAPRLLLSFGIVAAAAMLAVMLGLGGGLFGWFVQVLLLTVLVPALLIALNYRFGLLAIVVLMPFSGAHFIPRLGPLSVVNFLMLGVLSLVAVRLMLKRMMHGTVVLPLPIPYLFLYLVPITIAYLIGTTHLGEIAPHLVEDGGRRVSLGDYWISSYFKNMLFSLCGIALAVAVAEYRNAKVFMYAALVSAVLYVVATLVMFLLTSQTLEAAVNGRQMYSATGRHANSVGAMLLAVVAAALYMRDAATSQSGRLMLSAVSLLLIAGVLLTGSRGAMLGLLVVVALYLGQRRKIGTFLGAVLIGAVVLMAAPAAVTDRLTLGLSELSSTEDGDFVRPGDQLTSGRFYLAQRLLPEVMNHPLLGNGMGSTRWSEYAKDGGQIAHPHNMYLTALLDLGVVGSLGVAAFCVYVLRLMRGLSRDETLDPLLRAYFAGTFTGIIGYLAFGVSGGGPFPRVDQWFLWVGFGLALGCRVLSAKDAASAEPSALAADRRDLRHVANSASFWPARPR